MISVTLQEKVEAVESKKLDVEAFVRWFTSLYSESEALDVANVILEKYLYSKIPTYLSSEFKELISDKLNTTT